MRLDERGGVDPTASVFAVARTDEWRDEFAHFEMQMGKVTAISCADSGNLLAAVHVFGRGDEDLFAVTVVRLHKFSFPAVDVGMQEDDYVAPARAAIARK